MHDMIERNLTEYQRMMRNTSHAFVDREVTPFTRLRDASLSCTGRDR